MSRATAARHFQEIFHHKSPGAPKLCSQPSLGIDKEFSIQLPLAAAELTDKAALSPSRAVAWRRRRSDG
jgi:hypothetical protein